MKKIVVISAHPDDEILGAGGTLLKHKKEEDIVSLYDNAHAFLFPSLYEGFGIPIIEAYSRKLPVLTSFEGSCPEIANEYAVIVDPYSIDSMVEGIDQVVSFEQSKVIKAFDYARSFTWERTAKETIDVYTEILRR